METFMDVVSKKSSQPVLKYTKILASLFLCFTKKKTEKKSPGDSHIRGIGESSEAAAQSPWEELVLSIKLPRGGKATMPS